MDSDKSTSIYYDFLSIYYLFINYFKSSIFLIVYLSPMCRWMLLHYCTLSHILNGDTDHMTVGGNST